MTKQKISPAVIIPIGLGLGLAAALAIAAVAWAAPPKVYTCPLCGEGFDTLEELEAHFALAHPEEPMPTPWGYSDVLCSIGPGPADWSSVDFSAKITNIGSIAATKTVTLYWRRVDIDGGWAVSKSIELTLLPGETYQFTSDPETILIYPGMRFELYLVDSDGFESAHCFAP